MIKQIWNIRSKSKLFLGLSYTFSGLLLCYTILTLLVLEDQIVWSNSPETLTVSKYALLIVPVLSVIVCLFLSHKAHTALPLETPPVGRALSEEGKEKERIYRSDLYVGLDFTFTLFLFFFQIGHLNLAKGIPDFSFLILVLSGCSIVIWLIYSIRKILTVKG